MSDKALSVLGFVRSGKTAVVVPTCIYHSLYRYSIQTHYKCFRDVQYKCTNAKLYFAFSGLAEGCFTLRTLKAVKS